jgi:acyl-CoA dehydrogenase
MEAIFVTEKIKTLLPEIARFVEQELYPLETPHYLTHNFSEVEPVLREKRELVRKAGWWGLQLSGEHGGLGLSLTEFGQLSEVLAHSPFGHFVFNCQAPDIGNMELLEKYASEPIRHTWLHPLQQGQLRSCFAMTEPEFAGSNPVLMATTAVKDGTDYLINGHKWFTSSADGAAFAVVMAITNPDAAPHQRASQILVPTDTPGFRLVRNIPVMGHAGDSWASHAEVRFEQVRVPQSNLIGPEGGGFVLAQERLGPGRIHHCMRFIGIAERAFDLMCRYALQRDIEPGVKLAEKQFIQGFVAESRAEIDASRLLVLRTAHQIDQLGAAKVRDQISMIKFFTANMMLRVLDRAIQTHGALGMSSDVLLSFWYAHERAARIYDGADEVHKVALAKQIFKGYRM